MKYVITAILLLGLLVPLKTADAGGPLRINTDAITKDTSWSGEVIVEKPLKVAKEAALSINPGTVIRFRQGAGLVVEGVLKAAGTAKSRIRFLPSEETAAKGYWTGLSLNGSGKGTVVSFCRFEHAASMNVAGCSPDIKDSEFVDGINGIVLARKSGSEVRRNLVRDMEIGGISTQLGATPLIAENTVENCGDYGISQNQDAQPRIRGNTVTGGKTGISLSQSVPAVEGNTVKGANTGILVTAGNSEEMVVRGNKVVDNEFGIICQQFSSPLIERNFVKGNQQGVICFRASSPIIRNNEFTGNDEAIVAVQICNPEIMANSIHDNAKGIYLDLSSYALINGNNIYGNKIQLELGNMSSDWEYRVRNKPVRGSQAMNFTKADRGKEVRRLIEDDAAIMGYVDATGNWWGETVTREMNTKGPDADIESFIDFFDVPIRTYEGYEGEYIQDRIKYEGWKQAKIEGVGI